jgi:hypothetical protein
MIHISSRSGHEMLTEEEFKERHPALAAALSVPAPYKEHGDQMKQLRKAADVTIMDLAKACGWRLEFTSGLETGRYEPTQEQIDLYQTKIAERRTQLDSQRGACACQKP